MIGKRILQQMKTFHIQSLDIDHQNIHLDMMSIFFARLGNRDNHFSRMLFLLKIMKIINRDPFDVNRDLFFLVLTDLLGNIRTSQ